VNEERPSSLLVAGAPPVNVSDPSQVWSRSGPARAHSRAPRESCQPLGQESSPISGTAGERLRWGLPNRL